MGDKAHSRLSDAWLRFSIPCVLADTGLRRTFCYLVTTSKTALVHYKNITPGEVLRVLRTTLRRAVIHSPLSRVSYL